MRSRAARWARILLLAGLVLLACAGCGRKAKPEPLRGAARVPAATFQVR